MQRGTPKDLFTFILHKKLEEDLPKVVDALYYINGLVVYDKNGDAIGRYGLQVKKDDKVFWNFYSAGIERVYIITEHNQGKILLVYWKLEKGYIVAISQKLNPFEVYADVELLAKRLEKKL